jgi:hypothetical protein
LNDWESLEGVFMNRLLIVLTIFLAAPFAQAGFIEYVARCVEVGKDMESSRVYSLHINETRDKGILVAIDVDKLTEVQYGDIRYTGNRKVGRSIKMPSANATFKDVRNDAGGDAVIKGVKYTCDFSQ